MAPLFMLQLGALDTSGAGVEARPVDDSQRTREQLIAELQRLRVQNEELRARAGHEGSPGFYGETLPRGLDFADLPAIASILDTVGIGLSLVTDKLEIVARNTTMRTWFPDLSDIDRPLCYQHLHQPPREEPCTNCPVCFTLRDGKHHRAIVDMMVDGEQRYFRVISSPVKDENGVVTHAVELVEDFTVRQQAHLEMKALAEDRNRELQATVEELRASEERYRKIVDTSAEGVWLIDVNGGTIYANKRMAQMLATTLEQLMKSNFEDFIDPEWLPVARENLAERREGHGAQHDFLFRRADGGELWAIVSTNSIRDEEGNVVGALGMVADVSDRREVERQLQEREEQYRTLFENMAQGVVYHGRDGRIIDVNSAACRILGLTRDEALGRVSQDPVWHAVREDGSHFPGEEHPAMVALATGREVRDVMIGIRNVGTGEQRWISVSAFPEFREGDSAPHRVFATFTDVTALKRAKEQVRESEARYRYLYESAYVGLFHLRRDGTLEICNKTAARVFGYDTPEEARREFRLADHVANRSAFARNTRRLLREGRIENLETEMFRKDGSRIWVQFSARLSSDRRFIHGAGIDVTGARTAEEHMVQLQKLESLGRLAGGISHHFNNMLQGIIGNVEMAMLDMEPASPVTEYLRTVDRISRRAALLTRDMLALSGQGAFMPETVDVSDIVREVAELMALSLPARVELQVATSDEPLHVRGNPSNLRQALMNLINNACDALAESPGTVTLSAYVRYCNRTWLDQTYLGSDLPEGWYAAISVVDTGPGIPDGVSARLFEPFFSTRATGRGLGLTSVLGIVRAHRGTLHVRNRPNLNGASASMFIPLSGAPAPRSVTVDSRNPETSALVLLIDDEEDVLRVGSRMIESLGHHVITADSGEEGVRQYLEHRDEVSLVVLDMFMPGMDGAETCRRLREHDQDVRVLISSGFSVDDVQDRLDISAVSGFLEKPYGVEELREHLEAALSD